MLRWFLLRSWRYRYRLFLAFMLIPVVQGLRLLRPMLMKWILEAVEMGANLELALELSFVFIGAVFVNHIFQYFQLYLTSMAGLRIVLDIRRELFKHLLELPYATLSSAESGQLLVRLTSDVEALKESLSGGLLRILSDILAILGILIILLGLNWKLSLYVLVAIPILLKTTSWIGKLLREGYFKAKRVLSDLTTRFSESLEGMQVLRSYQKEAQSLEAFSNLSKSYRDHYHRMNRIEPTYFGFVEFSSSALLACILYDGRSQIGAGTLSFPELVAFITYIQQIMNPLRHLSSMVSSLQNAWTSMQRIFSFMSQEPEPRFYGAKKQMPDEFSLEFRGVNFSYGDEPVLSDLNFRIHPGERLAIVGRTGAGKSSIIKLINRFYRPQSGQILLGGVPIDQIDRDQLRPHIGFVLQEVFLFSGSSQENLTLFEPQQEALVARSAPYIKLLQNHGFLGNGQEPKIVENNGANYSLGEKQLLAFGRVFIKNAEIFLLDEATSSIDTRTEAFLQTQLEEFIEGKTTLIIAHRLSTLKNVDRILVLKEGQIVEEGSYSELVKRRGEFYEYFRHQYKEVGL
jgi:ATP-binding cassette, subfamily B, multidrug efflux pump